MQFRPCCERVSDFGANPEAASASGERQIDAACAVHRDNVSLMPRQNGD
jgi:hypothetical protein